MNLLSARTLERVDVRCVLEGKPDVVQPVDEVLLAERVDVEPCGESVVVAYFLRLKVNSELVAFPVPGLVR